MHRNSIRPSIYVYSSSIIFLKNENAHPPLNTHRGEEMRGEERGEEWRGKDFRKRTLWNFILSISSFLWDLVMIDTMEWLLVCSLLKVHLLFCYCGDVICVFITQLLERIGPATEELKSKGIDFSLWYKPEDYRADV